MYVNTLITLQENLATYAVDGKKVSGHVTISSPGMIKCYIQNLRGQGRGQEYAFYVLSKTHNKGIRIGKLSNQKESKWRVNEKDIEGSGLKLEELDAAAIVAEDSMRGADTIAMGFKNNRYIIIPLIDAIVKGRSNKTKSSNRTEKDSNWKLKETSSTNTWATINNSMGSNTQGMPEQGIGSNIQEMPVQEIESNTQGIMPKEMESNSQDMMNQVNNDNTTGNEETLEEGDINKQPIYQKGLTKTSNTEGTETDELELIKVAQNLQEVEPEPAIMKQTYGGTPCATSNLPPASAVRERDKEQTFNRCSKELADIVAKLKMDKELKEKISAIESEIESLTRCQDTSSGNTQSSMEETLERHYTAKQIQQEIPMDSSPKNAVHFIQHCMSESVNDNVDFKCVKEPVMKKSDVTLEEVDYISEIDRKIQEIEERRKQEINKEN